MPAISRCALSAGALSVAAPLEVSSLVAQFGSRCKQRLQRAGISTL